MLYFDVALTSTRWQTLCSPDFAKIVIISDKNVAKFCAKPLQAHLLTLGIPTSLLVMPAGEAAKTRETKTKLEDKLFALGCGRDTLLFALGGGVVTDLVGFLAATYCRGVPVVYIPTTLLAMVDAAIGGKTGVNTPYGKNLIGTITEPDAIWIDPQFLQTLPEREYRAAFAEIIKYACIQDKALFSFLVSHADKLKAREPDTLEHVIRWCIKIKQAIVKRDPFEKGERVILNFGHTIGHAIEKVSDYKINHGEAVSIGMVEEARLSCQQGFLKKQSCLSIVALIKQYGLPTHLPANINRDVLEKALCFDKKTRKQLPQFVLLQEIGGPFLLHPFKGTV